MALSIVLQEATEEEVQRYRRTVRQVLDQADKLDLAAVKDSSARLTDLRGRIADRLDSLQANGKLTPSKLGQVESEIKALSGAWAKDYHRDFPGQFGKRAYELGDQLATRGMVAAGLKLEMDLRSELDMLHSIVLEDSLAYRAAGAATQAALKMVRFHAVSGRDWGTVSKLLRAPGGYWEPTEKATSSAARTWAATAHADASLRRLQELADRTGGAVKMVFVLVSNKQCQKCPPYDGKVYEVRGGQAPRLPLHSNCRCSYVPWYGRTDNQGKLDPITPTPSPTKGKDFENVLGVAPQKEGQTEPSRPLLQSPFDGKGTTYAEDALQMAVPRFKKVTKSQSWIQMNSHWPTSDGMTLKASGIENHFRTNERRYGVRRESYEAFKAVVEKPEFSGFQGQKAYWFGRARLENDKEANFVMVVAYLEGDGYTGVSAFATDNANYIRKEIRKLTRG